MACALAFSLGAFIAPAYADGATVTKITNKETGAIYEDLATATADANSGDTILLPEGNYTLYKVSSEGHTKGKDLTFEGLGTGKTAWNIGALVPDPANYGTEYNGDYSFDGAGTVTFKNMTMRSGSANYLASFARTRPSSMAALLTARRSTGVILPPSSRTPRLTLQMATMPSGRTARRS